MSKPLPKTPAARFRRAAKTLAELGIKAELVRSCCRSCARYKSDADLLATEMDGILNPRSGWNKTGTENFRDWLNWSESLEGRLDLVVSVLNANGLVAELPTDPNRAIEVRFHVEPPAEPTCGYCQGSLTEDDLCGYGGHDLNELCKENLPDDERYRCCDCLSDLTGECCCSECTDGDPVPFMLVPSI